MAARSPADPIRVLAWVLLAVGILGAIAVPLQADVALRAFVDSSDFPAWSMLSNADRASGVWVPATLRPERDRTA